MAEREVLEAIFTNTAAMTPSHVKPQLAYRHMIALADTFDGWAQDSRNSPEQSAQILGWAESMRRLAEDGRFGTEPTNTGYGFNRWVPGPFGVGRADASGDATTSRPKSPSEG